MAIDSWNRWEETERKLAQLRQLSERAGNDYRLEAARPRPRGSLVRKLRLAALSIARVFLSRD
jgi:hypothetical protein